MHCGSVSPGWDCEFAPRNHCWRGYGTKTWPESHSRHSWWPHFVHGDISLREGLRGSRSGSHWCQPTPQICLSRGHHQLPESLKSWSSVLSGSQVMKVECNLTTIITTCSCCCSSCRCCSCCNRRIIVGNGRIIAKNIGFWLCYCHYCSFFHCIGSLTNFSPSEGVRVEFVDFC